MKASINIAVVFDRASVRGTVLDEGNEHSIMREVIILSGQDDLFLAIAEEVQSMLDRLSELQ